jgi:AmpE protein
MAFLALLIAVLLWNFSTVAARIQNDAWFFKLYRALEKILPEKIVWVVAIVLPSLLIGLFMAGIQQALFGLPALLLMIAIVIYGFGRGDLRPTWNIYVDQWRRGDFEAAYQTAIDMRGVDVDDVVETPFALHERARSVWSTRALERWFSPVFWFVAAGPAGIIAYRLLRIVADKRDEKNHADVLRVLVWIEWLPANLMAFTFALAGSFSPALNRLKSLLFVEKSAEIIVRECAEAALELSVSVEQYPSETDFYETAASELHDMKNLIRRSHIVWLVVLFGFVMLI